MPVPSELDLPAHAPIVADAEQQYRVDLDGVLDRTPPEESSAIAVDLVLLFVLAVAAVVVVVVAECVDRPRALVRELFNVVPASSVDAAPSRRDRLVRRFIRVAPRHEDDDELLWTRTHGDDNDDDEYRRRGR